MAEQSIVKVVNVDIEGITTHAIASALFQEATEIMAESVERVPVWHAELKNSATVLPPEAGGGHVEVTMGYGGAASEYALYVHEGTGPAVGHASYWVPKEAIRQWAEEHGFDTEQALFLLRRKIHDEGTKPTKFLEDPVLEDAPVFPTHLRARIAAEIERRAPRT